MLEPPPIDDPVYDELLRVYFDTTPDTMIEGQLDYQPSREYPREWDHSNFRIDTQTEPPFWTSYGNLADREGWYWFEAPAIKHVVRMRAGHRCERCRHPFLVGSGLSKWSPCDLDCRHLGPVQLKTTEGWRDHHPTEPAAWGAAVHAAGEARAAWRVLTVHHLNGVKFDCRWWNLAALCQRCHLTIQSKVHLDRPYDRPHTEWFRPHAAGYYAAIQSEAQGTDERPRQDVLDHMDEILEAHATQGVLL